MSEQTKLTHLTHPYYHIRLTHNIENPRYSQFFQERTSEHILVRENADVEDSETHLHCHFKSLHKNDQAVRKEFCNSNPKQKLGWFPDVVGNKCYSCKYGTIHGYNYVCKGTGPDWDTGKPTVLSTTFPEDKIKEFHQAYWRHKNPQETIVRDMQPIMEQDFARIEKIAKRKAKPPSWTELLIQEIRIARPDHGFDMNNHEDREYLVAIILKRMGKLTKALDEFIFRRTFHTVYNGLKKTPKSFTDFQCKFYRCLDK